MGASQELPRPIRPGSHLATISTLILMSAAPSRTLLPMMAARACLPVSAQGSTPGKGDISALPGSSADHHKGLCYPTPSPSFPLTTLQACIGLLPLLLPLPRIHIIPGLLLQQSLVLFPTSTSWDANFHIFASRHVTLLQFV